MTGGVGATFATPDGRDQPPSHGESFFLLVDYRGANHGCEPAPIPATIGFQPGSHLLTIADVSRLVRTANRVRTSRYSSHLRLSNGSQRRFARTVEIKEIKRERP